VGCLEDAHAIPWPHEVLNLKTVAQVEVDVNKYVLICMIPNNPLLLNLLTVPVRLKISKYGRVPLSDAPSTAWSCESTSTIVPSAQAAHFFSRSLGQQSLVILEHFDNCATPFDNCDTEGRSGNTAAVSDAWGHSLNCLWSTLYHKLLNNESRLHSENNVCQRQSAVLQSPFASDSTYFLGSAAYQGETLHASGLQCCAIHLHPRKLSYAL
jgi:hypothetical protein